MPMDGFTLSFMAKELNDILLGGRVDKVNQPSRDCVILQMRAGGSRQLLLNINASQARMQLTEQYYENPAEPPMFCMLMRKHLVGARLRSLEQVRGDRIVKFTFDARNEMGDPADKILYLEIMGRYSNLTLADGQGTILDALRHVNSEMSRVRTLLPGGSYILPPQPPKLVPGLFSPEELEERFRNCPMTLSKALCENVAGMAGQCSKEVCLQCGTDPMEPVGNLVLPIVCTAIHRFFANMKARPVVLYDGAGNAADFLPFPYLSLDGSLQKEVPTLSAGMDSFFGGRDLRLRMQQKSAGLQKQIKILLERSEKKRFLMLDTLSRTEETELDRIYGDLLTANLYSISKGVKSVKLQNYYDPALPEVEIPLSPLKTPVQNAQQYYRRYRKAKTAEQYAASQLEGLERDIALLEGAAEDIEKCETGADLAEIRSLLTECGYIKNEGKGGKKGKKSPEGKPYRFTSPDGISIEVGKNALQNDRLTLHARNGETWLHAQGIPGSHVIIHTEETPSDETLLYAAKLACYFSKGRKTPKQPIDYTLRKYVKKAPGAPAGMVTYTRYQTLDIDLTPRDEADILKVMAGL